MSCPRAVLEGQSGIVGFLRSDEHNLFARPALPLTLEMARDRDARKFAATISEMLRSDLKHYWKTAAAAALARVDGGDAAGYVGIGRLLTELPMLQRHFSCRGRRAQKRLLARRVGGLVPGGVGLRQE